MLQQVTALHFVGQFSLQNAQVFHDVGSQACVELEHKDVFISTLDNICFERKLGFTPLDFHHISQAYVIASQVHEGQPRDSGGSYIEEHIEPIVRMAMLMCPSEMLTPDLIISAILHDTVEDGPEGMDFAIRALFGDKVAENVLSLSKEKVKKEGIVVSASETVEDIYKRLKRERDIKYYDGIYTSTFDVQFIKALDRINNLGSSLKLAKLGKDLKKADKYVKETVTFYRQIFENLKNLGIPLDSVVKCILDNLINITRATELKSATTTGS